MGESIDFDSYFRGIGFNDVVKKIATIKSSF